MVYYNIVIVVHSNITIIKHEQLKIGVKKKSTSATVATGKTDQVNFQIPISNDRFQTVAFK